MTKGMASLEINGVSMSWDENARRVEKPCVVCGMLTRGRTKNAGGIPKAAHMACAFQKCIGQALSVFSPRAEVRDGE